MNKCPCCRLEIPEEWSAHGGWDFSTPTECGACKAPMKRVFDKEGFIKYMVFIGLHVCMLTWVLPQAAFFFVVTIWLVLIVAVFKKSLRYVAAVDCSEKKIRY